MSDHQIIIVKYGVKQINRLIGLVIIYNPIKWYANCDEDKLKSIMLRNETICSAQNCVIALIILTSNISRCILFDVDVCQLYWFFHVIIIEKNGHKLCWTSGHNYQCNVVDECKTNWISSNYIFCTPTLAFAASSHHFVRFILWPYSILDSICRLQDTEHRLSR